VAALRLGPGDARGRPEGLLADRFLFPLGSARWTPAERELLRKHRFAPEWKPPERDFSEWHYLVLRREAGDRRPVYDRPVAVLMDEACFSATDIFLGAFSGWRKTVLVGAPSGGGSGRARRVQLPRSGLELRLSSMASFRPDGRLYDGRGVAPDVPVAPRPTDLLGRTDAVLDEALRRLR
jgi:C-terminal processing protease CtpA/Prc